MESFLFEDSPLSHYLEGNSESNHERLASTTKATALHHAWSFAPALPSIESLKNTYAALQSSKWNECFVNFSPAWMRAMNISGAPSSASGFLEQFRYVIVASQLLSDHSNRSSHKFGPLPIPRLHNDRSPKDTTAEFLEATPIGLFVTIVLAFLVVPFARWILSGSFSSSTIPQLAIRATASTILLAGTCYQYQRVQVRHLRLSVIETASAMISNLQEFEDTILSNAFLIQETELLSQGRGCNRSANPISRLEESTNLSYPTSPRLGTRESINAVNNVLDEAIRCLGVFAVSSDLEKYYDIYEINRDNNRSTRHSVGVPGLCGAQKSDEVRSDTQNFRIMVKLLLCTLLALNVEKHGFDNTKWSAVAQRVSSISSIVQSKIQEMQINPRDNTRDEVGQTAPPDVANREHAMASHARILLTLSRCLRGIQSKMHTLYEDMHAATTDPEEQVANHARLAEQYRSLGFDFRQLLAEWEHGLEVWHPSHERNQDSLRLNRLSLGASLSSSLDGSTIVEDGPEEALQALDGRPRSSSKTSEKSDVSEQQILEGVAKPSLNRASREARLAKMKEDHNRQQIARESARTATTFMKELETVIKCRPTSMSGERVTNT